MAFRRSLALVFVCAGLTACSESRTIDAGADLGVDAAELGRPDLGPPDLGARDLGVDSGPPCTPAVREGERCADDRDCADGCFCTGTEECVDAVCATRAVPCMDTFACTTRNVCVEEFDRCDIVTDDTMCDDGNLCSGVETCRIGVGCSAGVPLLCDDGDLCTIDICAPGLGCTMRARDLDGDGFVDHLCGGDDCNDDPRTGRSTFPGAVEVCGDLRDQNCDRGLDYDNGACTSANDTCALALRIPAEDTDVEGGTRGATDDYALPCGRGGPDLVYRLFLAMPHVVELKLYAAGMAPVAALGDFAPVIAVRPFAMCAAGRNLGCGAGPLTLPEGIFATAELTVTLPAGEYALIVETEAPAAFVLRMKLDP